MVVNTGVACQLSPHSGIIGDVRHARRDWRYGCDTAFTARWKGRIARARGRGNPNPNPNPSPNPSPNPNPHPNPSPNPNPKAALGLATRRALGRIVLRASATQSLKGILTAGGARALQYLGEKVSKRFK